MFLTVGLSLVVVAVLALVLACFSTHTYKWWVEVSQKIEAWKTRRQGWFLTVRGLWTLVLATGTILTGLGMLLWDFSGWVGSRLQSEWQKRFGKDKESETTKVIVTKKGVDVEAK